VQNDVETWHREFSFVEEKEKQNSRQIGDIQANLPEISKRIEPIYERLELLSGNILRVENQIRSTTDNQESVRETLKSWLEQVQLGEHERKKQMEMWRIVLEEQEDRLRQHEKGWIPVMDQFKEAKMVLQTLADWQTQIEKQQREASELLRVESHRLQSRWDNYRQENDKRWRTFDVETEQRWSAVNRTDRQLQEQLHAIEEKITVLDQEKSTFLPGSLYQRLARKAAEDHEVLALMLPAQPNDRLPHLLFAAVQYLLLGEGSDPLSRFGEAPYSEFRAWSLDRRDELTALIGTRVVQTNEVARCAGLLPCLSAVAAASEPGARNGLAGAGSRT
jgi:hypothetical protein